MIQQACPWHVACFVAGRMADPRAPVDRFSRAAGVTLPEIMVVLAIVGVITGLAMWAVKSSQGGVTAASFANVLAGEVEDMRLRAVSTRRWQRLTLTADGALHEESVDVGLKTPTGWNEVRPLSVPRGVYISAVSPRTHVVPEDSVPGDGFGFDAPIVFKPDGSGAPATIFVGEEQGATRARVAIYAATGAPYVFSDW